MAWRVYIAMRLKVRLAYRGDFLFNLTAEALTPAVGLLMVLSIYHHVPTVRGYSVNEVLLGWGLGQSSLGLFWVVFSGLSVFNRLYLIEGGLDRTLLRPLNPFVQVLVDHLNVENLPTVGMGLAVFAMGAMGLGQGWSAAQWLMLPVFIVSGAMVVGGVLTAVSAVGFWTHHQGSATGLVYTLTGFGYYPLSFLPRVVAVLLCTVLPFAFMGFIPATFYMDRPMWIPIALSQPLVGCACMAVGYGFWRLSLRRYASTGS